MNRKEFNNYLSYNWWAYVAIVLVVVILWLSVFTVLAKPSPNEKLHISFVGTDFYNDSLETQLKKVVPTLSSQEIKSLYVESVYSDNTYILSQIVTTRCIGDTDFLIYTRDLITDEMGRSLFAPLSIEDTRRLFGDVEVLEFENKVYGILVFDGNNSNNFSKYYNGEEKCYLSFTPVSENIAGLNNKGNQSDDIALKVVQWLLEVNDGTL